MSRRKVTTMEAVLIMTDIANGKTKTATAAKFNISRNTIYRIIKNLNNGEGLTPRVLKPCGSNAAYTRHIRAKEYACLACCEAHAKDVKRYKKTISIRKITEDPHEEKTG